MSLDEKFESLIEDGKERLKKLEDDHKHELAVQRQGHEKEVDLLRKEFESQTNEIKARLQEHFDSELEKLKMRATSVTTTVLSAALFAILGFLWIAKNDVFSGVTEVNQSVISLQASLLAAQDSIQKAKQSLDKAANEGVITIQGSTSRLGEATVLLKKAEADLQTTKDQYDQRLEALKRAGKP